MGDGFSSVFFDFFIIEVNEFLQHFVKGSRSAKQMLTEILTSNQQPNVFCPQNGISILLALLFCEDLNRVHICKVNLRLNKKQELYYQPPSPAWGDPGFLTRTDYWE